MSIIVIAFCFFLIIVFAEFWRFFLRSDWIIVLYTGWRSLILKASSTVEHAIENLNSSSKKIVLVTDANGFFVGVVTDGDIRRGLLKNVTLHDSLESVVNKSCIYVGPECSEKGAKLLMEQETIWHLPVLTENKELLGVFLREDPSSNPKLNNILLVMAGGRGVRLMPLTSNCPKPMLLLGDKPILEHTINKAKRMGFSEIVISINYLGTVIQDYFNDGSEFGVKITYLEEGEPLGTGGALRLLQGDLKEPVIVINGDVVTEIDYIKILEFHETQKAHATMAVRLHEWQHPFGVVNVQQSRVVGFEEKPINQTYINSGTYVIGDKMRKLIKDGEKIDMPDLLMRGSEAGLTVLAYVFDDAWIDIGRVEEYEKANKIFAKKIPLEF